MKTFFRFGIPVAILAVLAGSVDVRAAASAPFRQEQSVRHAKMEIIGQKLGLTDAQKASLKTLRSQSADAIRAIRANPALAPEQMHAQVVAARNAAREQMRAILTPDQQARMAEIMSHRGRLNAEAVHRVRMGMLASRLGLTHEQRAQIKSIHQKMIAAVTPVRADASLTAEQKQAKVRELRKAGRDETRAVLTAEQQHRLNRIRQRMLGPLD
jgi:Spy/CpxP family protein refolding chaperone